MILLRGIRFASKSFEGCEPDCYSIEVIPVSIWETTYAMTALPQKLHSNPQNASTRLKENIPVIMKLWAERARSEIPAASKYGEAALHNELPNFFQGLSNIISTHAQTTGGERFAEENRESCKAHGRERASLPEYTLDQVINEYRILRQTIFEFLEQDEPLTLKERDKLLESIDCGISQAATEFAIQRGFAEARLGEVEAQIKRAQSDLGSSKAEVSMLQKERALREQFVATLSHDLRTPLTSARASAELISRQPQADDFSRKLAFRIVDDITRTDRMIRDLLDASRIRAGEKLSLKVESCNLYLLAQNVIQELASVYGERFLLECQEKENVMGYWSPSDLRRCLENLLLNAIKYGDSYSPITVKIEQQCERIKVSIHNEGQPISAADQVNLFRPYQQIQSTQASGKKGWGLGLTIVYGIAEAHGGTVGVESTPENGTTFFIDLPKDSRSLVNVSSF